MTPAWSSRRPRSAPAARCAASKPTNPTNAGNPTSPTGTSPAPTVALDGRTPAAAYQATPKASPASGAATHFRVRLDHVDTRGKISLRRAGRMHHLGIGYTHRGQPAIVLIDATTVTVIHRTTGEVLSTHDIDPDRIYWRNKQQEPGRWPGSQR